MSGVKIHSIIDWSRRFFTGPCITSVLRSFVASMKFVPRSDRSFLTFPRMAKFFRYGWCIMSLTWIPSTSIWLALVVKHVNIIAHRLLSAPLVLHVTIDQGLKVSIPMALNGGPWVTLDDGKFPSSKTLSSHVISYTQYTYESLFKSVPSHQSPRGHCSLMSTCFYGHVAEYRLQHAIS